jgi:hypothetical protein
MATPPDSNVRPARRAATAGAGSARDSALARLLLRTCLKLLLLLPFAAASSVPACVVPVGPEFQDPPGAPNAAPEILNPNIFPGAAIAALGSSQTFSFTVTDPNAGDTLHLRWVSDSPPFDMNASRNLPVGDRNMFPPAGDGPQHTSTEATIHCFDVYTGISTHRIYAVLADRDFADQGNDYFAVLGDGKTAIANWTLTLNCPAPQ